MKKFFLLQFFFIIVSCLGQETISYYEKCMQNQLKVMEVDFYSTMHNIEEKMLEIGALNERNKESYLKAFESLIIENDTIWKSHYSILSKTVLKDINLEIVKLPLFSFCSDFQSSELHDLDVNTLNIHKFFLKKLNYKSYDDTDILDGLFLFTNFKEKSLRFNITYLLLLNLDTKYGQI